MTFFSCTVSPALSVCCLAVCSCGGNGAGGTRAAAAAQPVPHVEVTVVKSQKLNATVPLPAELAPYEAVDIYARMATQLLATGRRSA